MHFTFIFVGFLASFGATYSHPTTLPSAPTLERNDPNPQRARPIQQFFKNIFSALRPTTTAAPTPSSTKKPAPRPSLFQSNIELNEIPNYIDFSTYLLNSFTSNNSAIKFTYMNPNTSSTPALRGNFSVITFLVPHEKQNKSEMKKDEKSKGFFSFLGNMRLPWSSPAPPSNTDFSQFPPFLEYFTQRIQAYFSVYKYTDDSRFNNTIVVLVSESGSDDPAGESGNILGDEGVDTTTDYQMETTTYLDESTTLEADLITTLEADEAATDITTEMK